MLQGLIFLGFMLIVLGPVHWYLWRRLVKDTTRPGRARKIGTIAIITMVVALIAAFTVPRIGIGESGFAVAIVGYLWLAVMFYLLVVLLALEIPRLLAYRVTRPTTVAHASAPASAADIAAQAIADAADLAGQTPAVAATAADPAGHALVVDIRVADQPRSTAINSQIAASPVDAAVSRRLLISRSMAIFAGLTATGVVAGGVRTALGDPVLKRIQIPLAKLPRSLDGYRIALVSDIHLGPLTGINHTRRIVRSINGMNPNLIAVVGDLVDGSVAELSDEAAPLRELSSKDGAYFVTGNHEYYSGAQEWIDEVTRLGLRPLRNERLDIRGLDLAGVNDVTGRDFPDVGGGPDFAKTLGDRDPVKPVILLAHQPIQAREAAKYRVDLQLSGHTHGGQMVPFNYIASLQQPVISGLGDVDGTKVYVTNGAGFWGPPVRVGAPPDITLVELRTS